MERRQDDVEEQAGVESAMLSRDQETHALWLSVLRTVLLVRPHCLEPGSAPCEYRSAGQLCDKGRRLTR